MISRKLVKNPLEKRMDALKYKKETPHEHVLNHPEMYIGPVESQEEHFWIYESEKGKMVYKQISVNQGLLKIVDEILVNARDALVRTQMDKTKQPIKHIEINVTQSASGQITIDVENDGDGIPIAIKDNILVEGM